MEKFNIEQTVNERIKYICEKLFGNLTEAARRMAINPNTLRGLAGDEQRGKKPQEPKLGQIKTIIDYTHCSPMWLIWGEGTMFERLIRDGNLEGPGVVEADTPVAPYDKQPDMVNDNVYLSFGTGNNNINGSRIHASGAASVASGNAPSSVTPSFPDPAEETENRRLRGQNFNLSKQLSDLIAQNHILVQTNNMLSQHIITLTGQPPVAPES